MTHHRRAVKAPEYWRIKNGIGFVKPDEEMVEVYLGRGERTFDYPISCVFREFERGKPLPEDLKKDPAVRVRESSAFVRDHLNGASFLGQALSALTAVSSGA